MKLFAVLFLVVIVSAGCMAPDDATTAEKPALLFEGLPDSRFVGTWKSDTGNSTYNLKEDGSYHIKSKVTNRGQTFDTESDGEWRAKEDRLLFKDPQGNVVPYLFKLDGRKLTLTMTGSMKGETVLLLQ
ncbi:MAG TPA: hypothetical protein VGE01_03660 [Fimbriimonas sp.]